MVYELSFKGKKIKLNLEGKEGNPRDIKHLLETIHKIERHLSEPELRNKVVRQLKQEILSETDGSEDIVSQGWWDLPQDLLRNKEVSHFLTMEADLNPAVHYDKTSFSLKLIVDEKGKKYSLDRESFQHSMQRLQINDKLKKTSSMLVRIKGTVSKEDQSEIEDYLRKTLTIDRLKLAFERKKYGDRVSVEVILFGDFIE